MNCCKHKYFVVYRGDDTDFPGNQELIIELNTTRDLTGCKAHFRFQGFTQNFDEIPSDKKLRLIIPSSATSNFALGAADAKLWLTHESDDLKKIRTVENRIHIVVTNNVDEAYDNDDPQAITVTINGADLTWENIRDKPNLVKTINGEGPDADGNIELSMPSSVESVNSKTGAVVLTAEDIETDGYGTVQDGISAANAGVSNVGMALNEHVQDGDIHVSDADRENWDDKYTQSQVDEKINQFAAHYLTWKDDDGHFVPFATHGSEVDPIKGSLAWAKKWHSESNPQFWYGDEGHTPDKNDYCVVLADETHNGSTTRYMFVGDSYEQGFFRYQYTINETAFTAEQWAAINSLMSIDENGNLCFDDIPIVNSSGELLETDPAFSAWKDAVQIALGSGANFATGTGKYKQIAIGANATTSAQNAIALGSSEPMKSNGPRATAQNAVAIGAGANATAQNAIQFFTGTNNTAGTIQVGSKIVAFLSDIPISQADIDDYRYYKGHWSMSVTYNTGDIVRAERTVEGQEEKEITYFKSLKDGNFAQNPFNEGSTYWRRTTDDEGLEKLTLFVKAAIAGLTGQDISVSPTDSTKISTALSQKRDKDDLFTPWDIGEYARDHDYTFEFEVNDDREHATAYLYRSGILVYEMLAYAEDLVVEFPQIEPDEPITATRKKIATTDQIPTDAKITQLAADAIKTNQMPTEDITDGSVAARVVALETAITGVAADLAAAIGEEE